MTLVWQVLRQHRTHLAAGLALMLLSRASALLLPATTKYVYDDVIARGRAELLLPLAGVVLGASIVMALSSYLLTVVLSVAAQRTIAELRMDVQRHVLDLPMRYHDATLTGETVPRVMLDPEGVMNLVGTGIIQLVGGILTAVLGTAILLYLNWQLALGTLLLLLAFGVVTLRTLARLRPLLRERAAFFAELSGRMTEQLAGLRVVKAFGTQAGEQRAFAAGVGRLRDMTARALLSMSLLASLTGIIVGAIGVVIMIAGGRAVLGGTMTPGELLWFAMTVAFVARPLHTIADASTQLMQALAGLDRIHEIQALPAETTDAAPRLPMRRVNGDVVFDHVTFHYDGDRGIDDVSFHAPAGSVTAITGPSGAGKSTLLYLLTGLEQPDSGRILIDGCDLQSLRLTDYRRHLGVVMQDVFLFSGTVRANVTYGCPEATAAEIEAAAHVADLGAVLAALPAGYETVVGERGTRLSAGQRQRIALARALLKQPRILILDEATAHLDAATEERVLAELRRFRRGRTTFIIAHNEASVRGADRTLQLHGGRAIAAPGSAPAPHTLHS